MKILIVYYLKNQPTMSKAEAEDLRMVLDIPVFIARESNKVEGRQYPYFDIKEVPITKDNA